MTTNLVQNDVPPCKRKLIHLPTDVKYQMFHEAWSFFCDKIIFPWNYFIRNEKTGSEMAGWLLIPFISKKFFFHAFLAEPDLNLKFFFCILY